MKTIQLKEKVGPFAENKDVARDLRINVLLPTLEKNEEITIDFQGITGATQSFIHALISDLIRQRGAEVLEKIAFKNCNESVQKIINIVATYMQESI